MGNGGEQYPRRVDVLLYTWSTCAFCKRAKELLDGRGVAWSERPLDGDRALADRLTAQLGRPAMPFAMVDGELVGGLEELEAALDAS